MRDNDKGNVKIGNYHVDLDITEALLAQIDADGKQKEKYTTHMSLLRSSGHQIELVKAMAGIHGELAKVIPKFYQKRVEDHRKSLRLEKVLSFLSASSIEKEATKRAREDTRILMEEISLLNNASMRTLVEEHTAVLKRLCDLLVSLMEEEGQGSVRIDIDALRKFLEGGK